ncbi:MAG TPA: succinate--CoA ligase subunit alpha, partial [Candidatus Gracilibacteria bacterium]|nr:succinate--CoA ligase subunit alpha [Candidatus Gracilibacteria bacterium]
KVGVLSRSGTLTYEIVSHLTEAGIGQRVVVGIGGDMVTGLNFLEGLELMEQDESIEKILLIGEIGGDAEERAAAFIREHVKKPVVAYIAGRTAPPGKTMGHAGAIISQGKGTFASKKKALEEAGVKVSALPKDVVTLIA